MSVPLFFVILSEALGKVNVFYQVNVNVNVVYSGRALSFEIASLGTPLKHRKQITLNEHNSINKGRSTSRENTTEIHQFTI